MPMITCHECEERISDQAPACPKCGVPNPDIEQAAPTTGAAAAVQAVPAINIINTQTVATPVAVISTTKKSKYVAAALAFFLGGFGVHRFYVDRPLSGVLYLVFCWTWIPSILGLLETVCFLSMNEKKFAERYAK